MKTIEITAQYKMGHTFLKCKTILAVRNINYIQQVPEEVPEYLDGVATKIGLPTGETLLAIETYGELNTRYQEAMEAES